MDRTPIPPATRRRRNAALGLLLALGILTGCTGDDRAVDPAAAPDKGLAVACTVGMLADLATTIVGDRGSVKTLMGPGTDPHLYKASPGDVATLHEADVILFVGHHLEGRMAEVFERLASERPAHAIAERIPEADLLHGEEGAIDPHLWFDVKLWGRVAIEVGEVLAETDPDGAAGYRERAAALRTTLDALDAEVRARIETIPSGRRVLVTAHDAFRYFGHAYAIEVVGVQGLSTESEAAVRRINELVTMISQRKVPAVFVESTVPRRNIEALVEGCRARGHTLTIGGTLYSDAMGAADSPAGTYVGMVRHNVETLVTALGGAAANDAEPR